MIEAESRKSEKTLRLSLEMVQHSTVGAVQNKNETFSVVYEGRSMICYAEGQRVNFECSACNVRELKTGNKIG